MKYSMIVLSLLSLSGCVGHWYFVRPSISKSVFVQDEFECATVSKQTSYRVAQNNVHATGSTNVRLFDTCMRAKGYKRHKVPITRDAPKDHYYSGFSH